MYAPYHVGGAERAVQLIAGGCRDAGHDVAVLALHDQPQPRTGRVDGIDVHYVPLRNVYWPHGQPSSRWKRPLWHLLDAHNPMMARAVAPVVAAFRPDVVNFHNIGGFSPSVWGVASRSGASVVQTFQDYHTICPRSHMFRGGANCETRCLDCRLLTSPRLIQSRNLDAVVGITDFVLRRHLESGLYSGVAERLTIGNPVQPAPAAAVQPHRAPTALRAGFIGRLTPYKGVSLLHQLLPLVSSGQLSLTVAGRGDATFESAVRGQLEPRGVRFPGWISPDDFYREIDVLIVPSLWHEPFGLVVVEAMARGIPVIGSNRGGIPELIDAGRTGWIVDPDASNALHETILPIVQDPERLHGMADACRASAARFTPSIVARRYLDLFTRLTSTA